MPAIWCRLDRMWFGHPGIMEGTLTRQPFLCPMDHVFEVILLTIPCILSVLTGNFLQKQPPNVYQFFFHFIAYWSLHYFVETGTNLPNSTECELNPWLISLSKIIWFIPYQRLHELWSFFFWLKMTVGSHATKLDCSGTSRGILALYGPKKELMMPITQIK